MSAGHTPTPWVARETTPQESDDPYWLILSSDENANEGDALVCEVNDLSGDDARFICRAVNAHDDLVEALQAVELARNTDEASDWQRATDLTRAALSKALTTNPTGEE